MGSGLQKQFEPVVSNVGLGYIDLNDESFHATDKDLIIPFTSCEVNGRIDSMPSDTIITQFATGHGWTSAYATTGTLDLNHTSEYYKGSQCVKMVSSGTGGNIGIKKWAMTSMDFTGKMLKIALKISNSAHLKQGTGGNEGLLIYLGSNSLSKYFLWTPWNTQSQQYMADDEWCELTLPFFNNAALYSESGSPSRDALTDINIRVIDDGSGNAVTLYVGEVSICSEPSAYSAGCISFAFDDSYAAAYSVAKPIMDPYGWKGTLYTCCDLVGSSNHLTIAQMQKMNQQGWDVAHHSYLSTVHQTSPGGYASAGLDIVQKDMTLGKAWLRENGFHGHTHMAYPKGYFKITSSSYPTDVLNLARKNFKAARTISSATLECYPPASPHRLRAYTISNPTSTLANMEAMVDDAVAAKTWLIFVFHDLVTTPTASTEWATSDFTDLCAYIAANYASTPIYTIAKVLGI